MAENRHEVLAIIPVRGVDIESAGEMVMLAGKPLLQHTVEAIQLCSKIDRVIVTSDDDRVRDLAIRLGAEAPFLRPAELAAPGVSIGTVLKHCLQWLDEMESYVPVVTMPLEISHPIRPVGLLEQVLDLLFSEDLDTVFTAYEEHARFWQSDEYGELGRLGQDQEGPRTAIKPFYREVAGLALACRIEVARSGVRFGKKVGLVPIRDPSALVDTQTSYGLALAAALMDEAGK